MNKIGLVILNWNNFRDSKKCINSILLSKEIDNFNFEIFLIDNDSQDGSGEKLKKEFSNIDRVNYYNTGENGGYTGGNNFGIQKAIEKECDYILVLNNDLYIENFSNIIKSVYKTFNYDKQIGIIGFEVYNLDTKEKITKKNKSDIIINKILNIDSKNIIIDEYNSISFERSVCGCAICFRKECIEEIGLFDENFFMYAEEHDICLRAIKNNWKVVKIKSSMFKIYRKIDPISINQLIWYYNTRNIFCAYKKNITYYKNIIISLLQIFIFIRQIIYFSFTSRLPIALKMIKGLKDAFINKNCQKDIY